MVRGALLYTGAALMRLTAAAAKSKVDFLAGLKAARPRDYLKEAVQQAISKKPPKAGAPDYKALTAAVHALVRAGDQAVTREARFAELERDRIGAQYLEEHRRWLAALEDVVLFAHKTLRKAAESSASSCSESKLKDVGVATFRERCGAGVIEGVERALRERAAQALPAGDAGGDLSRPTRIFSFHSLLHVRRGAAFYTCDIHTRAMYT